MKRNSLLLYALLLGVILLAVLVIAAGAQDDLTDKEALGKAIFFDKDLSINKNQSCASCHDPQWGWVGPDSAINAGGAVYEGSIPGRFGDRKPPSAAYATLSPIFHQDKSGLFIGGNFWDGRATGAELGNPAADQALGPFLNPVEQALPDSACVVYQVCKGEYPVSFEDVWGDTACDIAWPGDVETACATEGKTVALSDEDRGKSDMAYGNIGLTIAAYEDSPEVNAFTSKYDQTFDGKVKLTKEEQKGYSLFRGKGMCHRCHPGNGQDALFTDFSFDNLGVPKNPENPVYDDKPDFEDPGLGGFLMNAGYDENVYLAEWGKHKVPTLRNVDLRPDAADVKAFAHNGYFKSLEQIVHFYNTRDVKPSCESLGFVGATAEVAMDEDCWPMPEVADNVKPSCESSGFFGATAEVAMEEDCWPLPEVADNVNTAELGDLGLSAEEEAAIVAFLQALSDGYQPEVMRLDR